LGLALVFALISAWGVGGVLSIRSSTASSLLRGFGMADPQVTDRLVQIGNICRQWAYLEYLFSVTIWNLLKLERNTGMIVTGGLDMLPRAGMAINLAEHLGADGRLIEALKTARRTLQRGGLSLIDRRNIAIHGLELRLEGRSSILESHRGKGAFQPHDFGNDELKNLGKEIIAVHEALSPVMKSLGWVWI
jgi:hypothetical protein